MQLIEVKVKGIVQGVGFRPFVYKIAKDLNLNGWVNNDDRGVNIHIQGKDKELELFLNILENEPPPLAKIDTITTEYIITNNIYNTFKIKKSENLNNKSTIISPDIAICKNCIEDITNKSNFRFNYALTNCTNCGPRYSIIKTVPYDRKNTSMSKFNLCDKCKKEYEEPTNRRYHAQPVSCEDCGPKISLYNTKNEELAFNIEAIKKVADLINKGKIVAIKGLGGFHLVCDATNEETIKELRARKNRPTKPFAVMFKSLTSVKKYAFLSSKEEEIVNSKEKPIILVKRKNSTSLASTLAPNIDKLGCFIAYTPLSYLLFKYLKNPIVATSANLSDEPILRFKDELILKLSNVIDYILDFDRDIINACDDSVVQVVNEEISILRNARGYAPSSLKLKEKTKKNILALGANQKSTISLAFEDNLILSPHIGDLGSLTSLEYLERSIETFKSFYDFEPELLICDKHPSYESTKWALKQGINLVQIQHHYAHVLSTMAEYNLKQKVIAFAFDGTGYGDDGNIWGGEVFYCDNKKYERVNHFEYFKLLGSQLAIKEPKRVGLSLLFENFTLAEVKKLENPCVKAFTLKQIELMHKMWKNNLNIVSTSSVGRIFDAIASLSGLAQTQSYEGETGLKIEQLYDKSIKEAYSFELVAGKISLSKMIKELLEDKESSLICSKFINMLVNIIIFISKDYDCPIVLTGGVFQNKTLLELVSNSLKKKKRTFYYNKVIPLNDGGISVGQIYSQL